MKEWTQHFGSFRGHPFVTSAHFWTFSDPPIQYVSINTILNFELTHPTIIQPVIYGWSLIAILSADSICTTIFQPFKDCKFSKDTGRVKLNLKLSIQVDKLITKKIQLQICTAIEQLHNLTLWQSCAAHWVFPTNCSDDGCRGKRSMMVITSSRRHQGGVL